ncbi:bifunctional folylpolyglutamate synthase/dihydrofolate synthase [Euzebyella saccharophila]|uniref:Dihydrofolate synthase/folylpolyglutamate synthase n=1 Tax=Euzebyella saccharophila TaxID=679664 RepID=A0ABV8JSH7_9FLAO|nr:folylpolyglutamate synthase/dihydrofolate synthase family protein [Euzebyella saccharophila]
MTYQETLDWMFAQLPMYQNQGAKAFNVKLEGILSFADYLGNPHTAFKSIHVAGTNGKGSSSHMIASILQEAGYKVGLYTSPHLKDFRERIRINGKSISKKFVIDFIERNQPFFEKRHLSFFEMTVGMAFDYFAQEKVDVAVIEVGLGGRLDSTNIITPLVSLITNIGYDHIDMLGDTLEKIAYEKAGIIKEGVPVVISELQEETQAVFEKVARDRNSSIVFAEELKLPDYRTSLLGNYQAKNVKGVLAVVKNLKDTFRISEAHIKNGLARVTENTGLMGRWQVLSQEPMVVCDTAHNKEGLSIIMKQLAKCPYNHLHMVLGFVKGKDLDGILPLLPKYATYYWCRPNLERGLPVDELLVKSLEFNLRGKKFSSVEQAYKEAIASAKNTDFVYVGGSTFTVAEIL